MKEQVFANVVAVVTLGVYVACRVLALIVPDFLFSVGQSWFHTWNLESVKNVAPFDLGTFLLGGVTSAVFAWAVAYTGVWLYKRWAK